jgi:imidazolonepropionase-like amidohydrolase
VTNDARTVVRPHRLLDVDSGELLPDRAVVLEGERIADVVPVRDAPAEGPAFVDLPEHIVLPGLVDCHAHLIGEPDSGHGYAELLTRSVAQEAFSGVRNARDTVLAGFTSVRDVGTFRAFVDVALRDAIAEGSVIGPRMQVAGAYVTCSGGGGDITGLATDVDDGVPRDLRYGVVDSVDDVRRVVRRIQQNGADLIKLIATGSVMSTGGVPGAPELTEDMIRVAVEEATMYGAKVAAHAHGAEGIKRAVRGGVASVEHGSLMDDEAIELLAASETFLVADIYDGDWIRQTGTEQGWDADVMRKNDETTLAQREGFAKCVKAGVKIAYGTDSGIYPHTFVARQLAYHVQWGQTPIEAIRAATVMAARLMGWEDRIGRISSGYFADLIGVKADPLEDVRALESVSFVMKGGDVLRHD